VRAIQALTHRPSIPGQQANQWRSTGGISFDLGQKKTALMNQDGFLDSESSAGFKPASD
jgi:hypothetical protein